MDKTQRQLIDTYFRKRNIARKQNYKYNYTDYELIYVVNNNLSINQLSVSDIASLLIIRPSLVDKLDKSDLNKLDNDYIQWILQHQPSLIDKLDLSKLEGNNMSMILIKQPQLVDKFDLSKLNGYDILKILLPQPKLVHHLKSLEIFHDMKSEPTFKEALIDYPNVYGLNHSEADKLIDLIFNQN